MNPPTRYPEAPYEDYNALMEYFDIDPEADSQLAWLTSEIWQALGEVDTDNAIKAAFILNSSSYITTSDTVETTVDLVQIVMADANTATVNIELIVDDGNGNYMTIILDEIVVGVDHS